MKVLITGAGGMLGSAVYPAFLAAGHNVVATDLVPHSVRCGPMGQLDVRDFGAIKHAVSNIKPDVVLHLAAETDLETCENDHDHAYLTNTLGTQLVALACRDREIPIVYISTAGVFDGLKSEPYTEFDDPRPINVYGNSKYRGELIVQRITYQHFIVRAGWMIGGGDLDHKFVAKVANQIHGGARTIYAVTDKLGTPTYTEDFARNLIALTTTARYGLYHMTCEGQGSRYDVAKEILDYYGRSDIAIVGVESAYFAESFPAPRPPSEMMRNYMLDLIDLNLMRPWREALRAYLDQADFRLDRGVVPVEWSKT